MGRPLMKAAVRCLAVVLAVAVAVPVASGIAAVTQTRAVPARLVGTWTRNVTSAEVKRANAAGILAGSVCTLTIKKSGILNASVFCTRGVGGFDGIITPAGTNRVHINLGLSGQNVYRWSVSGRLLTFTKIRDPVQDRVAVFWGVWKRK
jgi:hypothetical protein